MKSPAVAGVVRRSISPFLALYCFIAREVLDNIIQLTEQHMFIMQHHVSSANDDQLTEEFDIKVSSSVFGA